MIKPNFHLFDYDKFSSHLESEFSLLMIGEKEKEDEVLVEEEVLEGTLPNNANGKFFPYRTYSQFILKREEIIIFFTFHSDSEAVEDLVVEDVPEVAAQDAKLIIESLLKIYHPEHLGRFVDF